MISWKNGSAVATFHRSSCLAANPVAVAVKAEVAVENSCQGSGTARSSCPVSRQKLLPRL